MKKLLITCIVQFLIQSSLFAFGGDSGGGGGGGGVNAMMDVDGYGSWVAGGDSSGYGGGGGIDAMRTIKIDFSAPSVPRRGGHGYGYDDLGDDYVVVAVKDAINVKLKDGMVEYTDEPEGRKTYNASEIVDIEMTNGDVVTLAEYIKSVRSSRVARLDRSGGFGGFGESGWTK